MKHRLISLVEQFLDGRIDLQLLTVEVGMLLSKIRRQEKDAMLLAGSILGPIAEHGLGHRSDASLRAALEAVVTPLTTGTNMVPLCSVEQNALMSWGGIEMATATPLAGTTITMSWQPVS